VIDAHHVVPHRLPPIDAVAVASTAPKLTPSMVSNDGAVVAMFRSEYEGIGASKVKPDPPTVFGSPFETVPTTPEMVRTTLCCTPDPPLVVQLTNVAADHNVAEHVVLPIMTVPV